MTLTKNNRENVLFMIKIEKTLFLILLMCFFNTNANTNPFIRLDSTSLATSKKMIQNGTASKQTFTAYQKLIKSANNLLKSKNPTVMDKTMLPPTGNKHDYMSISRYWWPNPQKENGLPWVRIDGKTNPETQTDTVDRKRLGFMGKGVWTLSLAYYFTNDEKYANKAISMIETWFLNPDTLMNPNLEYAQSVPGNPNKRPTGILDGRSIVMFIPDAINLLSVSNNWKDNHKAKMTQWFTDYLNWLTESDLGIKGSLQKNNHGSWYKFQVASLALYLGNKPLARNMVELAEKSLDEMLNNEGGQIHELARSRSFFYSCFNLQALISIAVLGDKVGIDMWQYESENKKSLSLAIQYLTPVVKGKEWNHSTLKPIDLSYLLPIIWQISKKHNSQEYKKLLGKIIEESPQNDNMLEFWLLNTIS
ncbi:alginate lyase family protein [Yeosuana marina]|uniref:alginate lyase family protein n=1 Tax=Yeosuana marina TaxID=1565536 RepID=UPI0019D0CF7B|nr:alginate lyase family protein [Yeosuana marina]